MQHAAHTITIAQEAPDFTTAAVRPDGTIDAQFRLIDLKGQYVALFFWPLDHTLVCQTELLAFDHRLAAFKQRNCTVVGVSIDSVYSHIQWRNTPVEHGGIGPVGFTMVSDLRGSIAQRYGVRTPEGPANWHEGEDAMAPTADATTRFLQLHGATL
jgi:peroxiredoxin (alkyl hydroperoxide reductase subunit C)